MRYQRVELVGWFLIEGSRRKSDDFCSSAEQLSGLHSFRWFFKKGGWEKNELWQSLQYDSMLG